ncbi:MAG: 16S rRNA (uracil(1498)-N(3))-methyltransferase [Alphaproteobacteria bacterium]
MDGETSERMRARLHVTAALAAGGTMELGREQAHYLRNVLRLGPGAAVALFNGRDGEWRARVQEGGKGRAVLAVEAQTRPQDAPPDLWLAFAPIKRARLDFLVEKAVELGVARLMPVITRHTDVSRVNLDRLVANATEAAEQCERMTLPVVDAPVPLERLLAGWPADRRLLVCAEAGAAAPVATVLSDTGAGNSYGMLIGPEGGFAMGELDALRKLAFVTPISLGPRILRAETAALAALACWQALLGDWGTRPPRP